jgi:hypothetical protein
VQSVGETSLPSRSVTVTVVSKTYRRTRDNRALSTQAAVPYLADRVDICHLLDCRWSVGIEPSTTCSFGQSLSGCATNRCRNDVVVTASLRVFMLREFDDDCTNFREAVVWLGVSWSAWGDPDTFAAAFEKPTTSVSRCLRQSHCFAEHLLAGHCLEGCLVSQTSMSDRRGNRSDRLAHPDCARRRTTPASFG